MHTGGRAQNVPGDEFRGPPNLEAGFTPRVSTLGCLFWLREADSNRRSLAYEANGLPGFPIPRQVVKTQRGCTQDASVTTWSRDQSCFLAAPTPWTSAHPVRPTPRRNSWTVAQGHTHFVFLLKRVERAAGVEPATSDVEGQRSAN